MAEQLSAPPSDAPKPNVAPLGDTGLRRYAGYIDEEFLKDLRGRPGQRKLREMADNDPTVGAILFAISLILRAAEWTVEPAQGDGENFAAAAEAEAEFVEGVLFKDMSHSWADFINECLSMLVYGWSYHEIVWKFRRGPEEKNPAYRSQFTDYRVGIRKLPIRAQESLDVWDIQEDGGIAGMYQLPPHDMSRRFIPIEKALLFRPGSHKQNPEGRSLIRNAYKPWYYLNKIEEIEAIGIERELAGLPVMYVPSDLLRSETDADRAILEKYHKIVRDIRLNRQGALVLPSDLWDGANGPTSQRKVALELLNSAGERAIDTVPIVQRYQNDIARCVMAEFMMLGSTGSGSWALSDDKTDMFVRALVAIADAIEEPCNRFLLPRLWRYNALDPELMPKVKCGRIGPANLEKIGGLLRDMATAGAPLFPDVDLEQALRRLADLPEVTEEVLQEREAQAEHDDAMQEAALGAAQLAAKPQPAAPPPARKRASRKKQP